MSTAVETGLVASAIRRVRRTLDDAGASLMGRRVLALCSGGADSVALVALLSALPAGAAPRSLQVLFLDHGLREDVHAERAAAQAAAEGARAPFHERRCDGDLREQDGGVEAAARRWRYAVAQEVAAELGCDVVATGHTASDQLELVLLSLVGVTGRSALPDAMPVRRPLGAGLELVRPLLQLSRGDVEAACRELGLAWAQDPTNATSDAHLRNAVRHRVVPPLLELHPGAGAALARAGAQSRAGSDAARQLADAVLDAWDAGERLDVRRIASLDAPARRELLARWLVRGGTGRGLSTRLVDAVERLALLPGRAACARVDVAGAACVRRDGYDLVLQPAPSHGGPRP